MKIALLLCHAARALLFVTLSVGSTARLALSAQLDGHNDPSFNVADDGTYGFGPDLPARAVLLYPDGRSIVGGDFTRYNAATCGRIVRLLADGSNDSGFAPGAGFDDAVLALAFQPDGKLLVGGEFTQFAGNPSKLVARLNADGSLDPSFVSAIDVVLGAEVRAVAVQPDGRILVGGSFFSVGGVARPRVARLTASGQLDASYSTGAGPSGKVNALALAANGQVLVGGDFGSFDGALNFKGLVRTDASGALDLSFNPTFLFNSSWPWITSIVVQPDQRIFVGGGFSNCNGQTRGSVARLAPSGALDSSFNPGAGGYAANSLAVQSDGKVVVGGAFNWFAGVTTNNLVRLDSSGALDPSFQTGAGPSGLVSAVGVDSSSRLIVAGEFANVDDRGPRYLTRLMPGGAFDPSFQSARGADARVWRIEAQPDGKLLLGGEFAQVDGQLRRRVARVNADGTLDTSFDPGAGADSVVYALARQPDGRVLIGGQFKRVDNIDRGGVARLDASGAVDPSFAPGFGIGGSFDRAVFALLVQPDGRIVIAGEFNTYNLASRKRIARLHADGSLDNSFNPGLSADAVIYAVARQSDGKLLIGGAFNFYAGVPRAGVARLLVDGSLDPSFTIGAGMSGTTYPEVYDLRVLADGKVLIGGRFTAFDGVTRRRLARLLPSGALDLGFDPGAGANGRVLSLTVQPDGKALVVGEFQSFGGLARARIARVNVDGSVDASFAPVAGADATIAAVSLESDGRAVIGGDFERYDGVPRTRIARIRAFTPAPTAYCTSSITTSGCAPQLASLGSPSASASSGFVLQASDVEGQRAGLVFYGVGGRAASPWAAGSTSWLCVKAPTQRMSPLSSGGVAGQCDGVLSEDWSAWIAAHPGALGQPFAAGDVFNAQAWFRDPPAPKTTNLSNALEFTLLP